MIVSCPNCSLEQPLDPFCAGCGKQLPKLIAEHRTQLQTRNSRTRKFIFLSVLFFSFGFYVYYAYQNPGARPFASNTSTKTVKVNMALDTIKASKYRTKEFAKSLKVKNFAISAGSQTAPLLKKVKAKIKESTKTPVLKLQEFYILNLEACTEGAVESGPLSQDELSFFLDCAEVISKLSPGDKTDLDPSLPFENAVSIEQNKDKLNIKFELLVGDSPFTTSTKLKLSKGENRGAGYISTADLDKAALSFIEGSMTDAPAELLKKSAFAKVFGPLSDDKPSPKGYFLAVYE